MKTALIQTPLGKTQISGDHRGICAITIAKGPEGNISSEIPPELQACAQQLQEFFNHQRKTFDLQLNPEGTDFQKKVWKALLEIPYGATTSYGSLARKMGDIKSVRAVAAANGKNPLWIVIPCHRVIGADGSLTGYAGGIWRKKWLLEHEQSTRQTALFVPDQWF